MVVRSSCGEERGGGAVVGCKEGKEGKEGNEGQEGKGR